MIGSTMLGSQANYTNDWQHKYRCAKQHKAKLARGNRIVTVARFLNTNVDSSRGSTRHVCAHGYARTHAATLTPTIAAATRGR